MVAGAFARSLRALGFVGAFVAALLGVGGAIVMIPLLLYAPPLLELGTLDVKAVAGVTMTQVLVAATSGMVAHRRHRAVSPELARAGGVAMAAGSPPRALAAGPVPDPRLPLVFPLMVAAAALPVVV